jgi:hypothetical protein
MKNQSAHYGAAGNNPPVMIKMTRRTMMAKNARAAAEAGDDFT